MDPVLLLDLPDSTRLRFENGPVPFGRRPRDGVHLPAADSGPAPVTMSRHAGTFSLRSGEWWVENSGAAYLDIESTSSNGVVSVPRTVAVRLPSAGIIRIPPVGYEIRFRRAGPAAPDRRTSDGPRTARLVEVTPRQVDFLVALAEPELVGDVALVRRTIRDIAQVWSVQPITVERSLRDVRSRLSDGGLLPTDGPGRPGVSDVVARIVVKAAVIDLDDYVWADLHGEGVPRPSAHGPRFEG